MKPRARTQSSATSPTRAVAYVRVSTSRQADEGVSLDAQREKIQAYAALYGLEVIEVIVDAGVSASTLERPGLTRALAALRAGKADALIVAKLDRLTRSVRDLGALIESHFAGRTALLSVGEAIDTRSANGRMMLNILTTIAQWEREAIGERTSTALQFKASQGEFTGGKVPYGFKVAADGIHLEEHAGEQAVLVQARALHGAGLSLRQVAKELDRAGLRSRAGKPFQLTQVVRMVA